ncbi:MAG: sugar phosphate isomerase/epimerase [Meiothermus sp.]
MNPISFITANFVARQLGYYMTEGWMQGDTATQNYFRPLETFPERFGAMLGEIKAMGFEALDLWGAHLNAAWATPEHVAIAKDLLSQHGLRVLSFATWVGSVEALEATCKLAQAMEVPLIAGGAPMLKDKRPEAVARLETYGVKLGVENHPEKSPAEVLDLIGDGAGGLLGAACDTGWWATQGYSCPQAIRELGEHLFTVHLKDVKTAGAHKTCRLGDGVADIEGCVRALQGIGYGGDIGIEHEPETFDPTADVVESKRRLEAWLGRGA